MPNPNTQTTLSPHNVILNTEQAILAEAISLLDRSRLLPGERHEQIKTLLEHAIKLCEQLLISNKLDVRTDVRTINNVLYACQLALIKRKFFVLVHNSHDIQENATINQLIKECEALVNNGYTHAKSQLNTMQSHPMAEKPIYNNSTDAEAPLSSLVRRFSFNFTEPVEKTNLAYKEEKNTKKNEKQLISFAYSIPRKCKSDKEVYETVFKPTEDVTTINGERLKIQFESIKNEEESTPSLENNEKNAAQNNWRDNKGNEKYSISSISALTSVNNTTENTNKESYYVCSGPKKLL